MIPNTLISWSGGKDSCLALRRGEQFTYQAPPEFGAGVYYFQRLNPG
jgi:predicted phosphoadenosine phosphosulfate sulfurtransferase